MSAKKVKALYEEVDRYFQEMIRYWERNRIHQTLFHMIDSVNRPKLIEQMNQMLDARESLLSAITRLHSTLDVECASTTLEELLVELQEQVDEYIQNLSHDIVAILHSELGLVDWQNSGADDALLSD